MPLATLEKITGATQDYAETLTQSSKSAMAGMDTLAKAYQDVISRNVEKMSASFETLSSVSTPADFFKQQQALAMESVKSAIADSQNLAELTYSVLASTFNSQVAETVKPRRSVKKDA